MARATRQTRDTARPEREEQGRRGPLEEELQALRDENNRLRARLARGPTDETWFTPGVLSVLFLGLFFALWYRYVPSMRPRGGGAPVVDAGASGDYNPPAR